MPSDKSLEKNELLIQAQYRLIERLRESEERFRTLIESLPLQIWTYLPDGSLDYVNQNLSSFFGYSVSTIINTGWDDRVHPEDLQLLKKCRDNSLKSGKPYELDLRLRNHENKYYWFIAKALPLTNEFGKITKWIGSYTDITIRKRAERSMLLSSLVYQNSSEAMIITDLKGTIINVNPAFSQITGYTEQEAIGQTPALLNSGRQSPEFYYSFWKALRTKGFWQGEIWNKRKNGEHYLQWLTINAMYENDGKALYYVALLSDITEKKKNETLIWKQANFDQLTSLPNRRMFFDRLEQEIKKAQRANTCVALLYLDLDNFKAINDTQGHSVGDELLKQASKRLQQLIRNSDTVARIGGDEFTIIMNNISEKSDVEKVAYLILEAINQPFHLNSELAYISASIGITFYPDDTTDPELLLQYADQAMYASKKLGRNCLSYFTVDLKDKALFRQQIINDIHIALAENQFWLAYQPIVELNSHKIKKAEALIRWNHPQYGLLAPDEFIPIAEESGMILNIGDWVFKEAAQQVKLWRQQYYRQFQISINKSPVQFRRSANSSKRWIQHLKELSLSGKSISVEITEGLLLDASAEVCGQLLDYALSGMEISLDDFGTGYSSLAYLQKYDIDYIKIDKSFVDELTSSSKNQVLCKSIIMMAHGLGMKVIAEGIETDEQRQLLTEIGCDFGQGYLFSKPLPSKQFEKLFDNH